MNGRGFETTSAKAYLSIRESQIMMSTCRYTRTPIRGGPEPETTRRHITQRTWVTRYNTPRVAGTLWDPNLFENYSVHGAASYSIGGIPSKSHREDTISALFQAILNVEKILEAGVLYSVRCCSQDHNTWLYTGLRKHAKLLQRGLHTESTAQNLLCSCHMSYKNPATFC